jgi:hypothetical protein
MDPQRTSRMHRPPDQDCQVLNGVINEYHLAA